MGILLMKMLNKALKLQAIKREVLERKIVGEKSTATGMISGIPVGENLD